MTDRSTTDIKHILKRVEWQLTYALARYGYPCGIVSPSSLNVAAVKTAGYVKAGTKLDIEMNVALYLQLRLTVELVTKTTRNETIRVVSERSMGYRLIDKSLVKTLAYRRERASKFNIAGAVLT